MAICNCCGCVLVNGTTSVVSGSGSSGDPYAVEILDPMFSKQRYAVRRQRSTSQTIPDNTLTVVDFTTATGVSFDRGPLFSAPSSFIIPASGIYVFGANVAFTDNAVGTRYIDIIKTNNIILTSMESNSSAGTTHFVSASSSAPLYKNETLQLRVLQTSTAPLDIVVNAEQSPIFWAIYVGRFV
jgi:hypothetical protein